MSSNVKKRRLQKIKPTVEDLVIVLRSRDMVSRIFSFLDQTAIALCCGVSRTFSAAGKLPQFWTHIDLRDSSLDVEQMKALVRRAEKQLVSLNLDHLRLSSRDARPDGCGSLIEFLGTLERWRSLRFLSVRPRTFRHRIDLRELRRLVNKCPQPLNINVL